MTDSIVETVRVETVSVETVRVVAAGRDAITRSETTGAP